MSTTQSTTVGCNTESSSGGDQKAGSQPRHIIGALDGALEAQTMTLVSSANVHASVDYKDAGANASSVGCGESWIKDDVVHVQLTPSGSLGDNRDHAPSNVRGCKAVRGGGHRQYPPIPLESMHAGGITEMMFGHYMISGDAMRRAMAQARHEWPGYQGPIDFSVYDDGICLVPVSKGRTGRRARRTRVNYAKGSKLPQSFADATASSKKEAGVDLVGVESNPGPKGNARAKLYPNPRAQAARVARKVVQMTNRPRKRAGGNLLSKIVSAVPKVIKAIPKAVKVAETVYHQARSILNFAGVTALTSSLTDVNGRHHVMLRRGAGRGALLNLTSSTPIAAGSILKKYIISVGPSGSRSREMSKLYERYSISSMHLIITPAASLTSTGVIGYFVVPDVESKDVDGMSSEQLLATAPSRPAYKQVNVRDGGRVPVQLPIVQYYIRQTASADRLISPGVLYVISLTELLPEHLPVLEQEVSYRFYGATAAPNALGQMVAYNQGLTTVDYKDGGITTMTPNVPLAGFAFDTDNTALEARKHTITVAAAYTYSAATIHTNLQSIGYLVNPGEQVFVVNRGTAAYCSMCMIQPEEMGTTTTFLQMRNVYPIATGGPDQEYFNIVQATNTTLYGGVQVLNWFTGYCKKAAYIVIVPGAFVSGTTWVPGLDDTEEVQYEYFVGIRDADGDTLLASVSDVSTMFRNNRFCESSISVIHDRLVTSAASSSSVSAAPNSYAAIQVVAPTTPLSQAPVMVNKTGLRGKARAGIDLINVESNPGHSKGRSKKRVHQKSEWRKVRNAIQPAIVSSVKAQMANNVPQRQRSDGRKNIAKWVRKPNVSNPVVPAPPSSLDLPPEVEVASPPPASDPKCDVKVVDFAALRAQIAARVNGSSEDAQDARVELEDFDDADYSGMDYKFGPALCQPLVVPVKAPAQLGGVVSTPNPPKDDRVVQVQPARLPDSKKKYCRDFQKGSCRYGSRCKFLHELEPKEPCRAFQSGNCKYGDHCKYAHVLLAQKPTTSLQPSKEADIVVTGLAKGRGDTPLTASVFGDAAHVSSGILSGQLKKVEDQLAAVNFRLKVDPSNEYTPMAAFGNGVESVKPVFSTTVLCPDCRGLATAPDKNGASWCLKGCRKCPFMGRVCDPTTGWHCPDCHSPSSGPDESGMGTCYGPKCGHRGVRVVPEVPRNAWCQAAPLVGFVKKTEFTNKVVKRGLLPWLASKVKQCGRVVKKWITNDPLPAEAPVHTWSTSVRVADKAPRGEDETPSLDFRQTSNLACKLRRADDVDMVPYTIHSAYDAYSSCGSKQVFVHRVLAADLVAKFGMDVPDKKTFDGAFDSAIRPLNANVYSNPQLREVTRMYVTDYVSHLRNEGLKSGLDFAK